MLRIAHLYDLAHSKGNSQKHFPFNIPGKIINSRDSMTNNPSATTLDSQIHIYQVNVLP
jgi:hypothetical protein